MLAFMVIRPLFAFAIWAWLTLHELPGQIVGADPPEFLRHHPNFIITSFK
jgi:hypothetical protein